MDLLAQREMVTNYAVTALRYGMDMTVCACLGTGDWRMANVLSALMILTGMVLAANPRMVSLFHLPLYDYAIYFISF